MRTTFNIILTLINFSFICFLNAQTTAQLDSIIRSHTKTFTFNEHDFVGEGWQLIINETKNAQNLMLGEDHFSNEIPAFTKAIANEIKFDNFYIEVDPYSTKIIENMIHNFNADKKQSFLDTYGDLFSFYSLKPEFDLLEHIALSGTTLLGSDQIVGYSDRLVSMQLLNHTKNDKAKEIYSNIMEQSRVQLDSFLKNPQSPMFMMTPNFDSELEKLSELKLSALENQIIEDLKLSKTIYMEQNHKLRVRLIMNQVMKDYSKWVDAKNLFKYGANHLTRGESFLSNYDIGNLVTNITEANYRESLHIMIVGESGFLGSPFRGFPSNPVDAEKGFYTSYLKPFFNVTEGKDWFVFDLRPLRKEVFRKKLEIQNLNLERTIRGYDLLIIIPEVSAAKH